VQGQLICFSETIAAYYMCLKNSHSRTLTDNKWQCLVWSLAECVSVLRGSKKEKTRIYYKNSELWRLLSENIDVDLYHALALRCRLAVEH